MTISRWTSTGRLTHRRDVDLCDRQLLPATDPLLTAGSNEYSDHDAGTPTSREQVGREILRLASRAGG